MSNLRRKIAYLAAVLVAATLAMAQTSSIQLPPDNADSQLKPGTGEEVVRRNCSFCHSTDYIVRQPHLAASQWEAEVKKMIAVYGAPINAADAQVIADYLGKNYAAGDGHPKETGAGKP
jgi:mono/diheme cytochrome c family protein